MKMSTQSRMLECPYSTTTEERVVSPDGTSGRSSPFSFDGVRGTLSSSPSPAGGRSSPFSFEGVRGAYSSSPHHGLRPFSFSLSRSKKLGVARSAHGTYTCVFQNQKLGITVNDDALGRIVLTAVGLPLCQNQSKTMYRPAWDMQRLTPKIS